MWVDFLFPEDIEQRQLACLDRPNDRRKSRLDLTVLPAGEHGRCRIETLRQVRLRQTRHPTSPASDVASCHSVDVK